jgi:protein O-GlcNAc transferase
MAVNPEEELGAALQALQQGDVASAERLLRIVRMQAPDNPQVLHLCAMVAYRKGDGRLAAQIWRNLVQRFPACFEFQYNLGIVLDGQGMSAEAEAAYRSALQLSPASADAHYNLGLLLRRQERLPEAVASYRRAIGCRPAHAGAHNNLGEALLELGAVEVARASFVHALELQPDFAKAYNNLGKAASLEKRFAEAARHFEDSLALDPGAALVWNNLGLVLHGLGENERMEQAFERALAIRPDYLTARWNLCMHRLKVIYRDQDDVAESRAAYLRGLAELEHACRLDSPPAVAEAADAVGSAQPFYLAYQGELDREPQARYGALVARIMGARYPGLRRLPKVGPAAPGEKLRIGFVSRWFVRHSVWKIPVRGWVEGLDRSRFRLYGYHTGNERDDQTAEAESMFDCFIQGPQPLETWCERIREDALHVLIFPEVGMDPLTLKLAALRLAPVQCGSWGHPETTGLPTIDYYLSSDPMEPAGAEDHYTEQLVRLPKLSTRYAPLPVTRTSLTREQFGLSKDAVLFWCPQSIYKYLPRYDELFPRIALAVPAAQFLFIRYEGSDHVNEIFQKRLARAFAAFGLASADYCIHLPHLESSRFDALAGLCDVFLDSIGWSGCNTTLEAIARDLPVVTFPSSTMRSRHTAAILEIMGVTGATAHSLEEYIGLAAALGLDPERRRIARAEIAARKHFLYNDTSCIRALEDFLLAVASGPRAKS